METVEDETITGIPSGKPYAFAQEYSRCIFSGCDLGGMKLTGIIFSECEFRGCNLALANVSGSSFRIVTFTGCKLTGVRFGESDPFLFTASFSDCSMERASFLRMKIKKTEFTKCRLKEADFAEADCSGARFDLCDLERTVFERTNLERADLRTAFNYTIDPDANRLAKARFSVGGIAGLLDKYDIIIE
jgi:fluoroquinolone resistance protein